MRGRRESALDKSARRVRPHGVGTPDPLDALYDGHAPALFRFLVRLTGDEAEVKDILQEIFIRLAREPGLLRGVRAPRSYLFRMAHRLAIDHARRLPGSSSLYARSFPVFASRIIGR